MPTNDNGEQLCVALISGYGVCTRPVTHPIHKQLGVTPLEHPFDREKSGVIEEARLNRKNIRRIARRSGQKQEDLEKMRKLAQLKKETMTLRYDVLPEIIKAERGV